MSISAILIDDEAWTRDVLRKLGSWDKLGIEIVAEASDGEYGMALINRLNPDIIITDVKMPHMNGIELLKALRNNGNRAKVIFASGFDDYKFVHEAMKLQASDYLLKPIKPKELNERLAGCVEEIRGSKDGPDAGNLDLQGFMDVAWVQDYRSLQKSVYESLRSNDAFILHKDFDRLTGFICERKNETISKSLVICIYFDLHHWLQKYILENGYSISEILPGKTRSFVFSNDFSLTEMMDHIRTLYCDAQKMILRITKSKKRIDIKKIIQYIQENYCDDISLEEIAARFYVSKEYLSKIFKQENGINFSEYVTALRMKKAKELLLVNKIPIKEIPCLTGYAYPAHFYKVFKKFYRKTPGSLQKED
ncbi:MAG: response regulator [Treponema sp.]|nr:response regulator [Treponema sp.]